MNDVSIQFVKIIAPIFHAKKSSKTCKKSFTTLQKKEDNIFSQIILR